ncbi:MAG: acyl carrier protein [Chitinophagales bacterium]|jgi:acyl carrier protein|nr:acyl carrier protein [Chitinophagales bacterium]
MSTIAEQVKEIIAKRVGKEVASITDEASFQKDLQLDSLDRVELIMELEDTFGMEVPEEEADKLQTVADVISYINEKQSA